MPTITEANPISIFGPGPTPEPAPTQTQLQAGLGGAIGCDFRRAQSQLIFVEYSGKLSALTIAPAAPAYTVLGTGYNQPEDVKLSTDGVHAYVVERTGDLVRVSLSSANRSSATVIATGLTAPQQLFLDEANNAAYVVEYTTPGNLLKINLTTGAASVVASGLENPVGVVLSSDLQSAYVSEQSTGPGLGRISQIQISTAVRTTIASGLTSPFFLTWADAAEDLLLVPQRDPANSIALVNTVTATWSVAVAGVPFLPSSTAVPYPGQILVCCNSVIEQLTFHTFSPTAPLLTGIGYIPVAYITSTGLAATPSNSIYPVNNAPFGGTLPLIVNYQSSAAAGAEYYQVLVNGVPQTATWTVYGPASTLIDVPSRTVGASNGCYPFAALSTYWPQGIAYELDTTALGTKSNGSNTIQLALLDGSGNLVAQSEALTILVNNQSCTAILSPPSVNATPANACGLLQYGTGSSISLPYVASQPGGFATFSIAISRGTTALSPPSIPDHLSVSAAASPYTTTVSNLLLNTSCTSAAFAENLYVAANITNGWSRQSQYDAEALAGFALTP